MKAVGVCPLDGGGSDPHPAGGGFLVCRKCCETLTADELVAEASADTARRYVVGNGLDSAEDYQRYLQ